MTDATDFHRLYQFSSMFSYKFPIQAIKDTTMNQKSAHLEDQRRNLLRQIFELDPFCLSNQNILPEVKTLENIKFPQLNVLLSSSLPTLISLWICCHSYSIIRPGFKRYELKRAYGNFLFKKAILPSLTISCIWNYFHFRNQYDKVFQQLNEGYTNADEQQAYNIMASEKIILKDLKRRYNLKVDEITCKQKMIHPQENTPAQNYIDEKMMKKEENLKKVKSENSSPQIGSKFLIDELSIPIDSDIDQTLNEIDDSVINFITKFI